MKDEKETEVSTDDKKVRATTTLASILASFRNRHDDEVVTEAIRYEASIARRMR